MKQFAIVLLLSICISAQQENLTFVEGYGDPVYPLLAALGEFNDRAHAYYSQLYLQEKVVGDTTKLLYKHIAKNQESYIGIETQPRSQNRNPQVETFIISQNLEKVLNALGLSEDEINTKTQDLQNLTQGLQKGFNCKVVRPVQKYSQPNDCYTSQKPIQIQQPPCPQQKPQMPVYNQAPQRPVINYVPQRPVINYTPQRPVQPQTPQRPVQTYQPQRPIINYNRPAQRPRPQQQRPQIRPIPVVIKQQNQPQRKMPNNLMRVNIQGTNYNIDCSALRFPTSYTSYYKNNVLNTRGHNTVFTAGKEGSDLVLRQIYEQCQQRQNQLQQVPTEAPQTINQRENVNTVQTVPEQPRNQTQDQQVTTQNTSTGVSLQNPDQTQNQSSAQTTNTQTSVNLNNTQQTSTTRTQNVTTPINNQVITDQNNQKTTKTTTTVTRTVKQPETIQIGNFSIEEFDNLLTLLEGSPEAIGLLNVDQIQDDNQSQQAVNRTTQITGSTNSSQLGTVDLNLIEPVSTTNTQTVVTRTLTDQDGNIVTTQQQSGNLDLDQQEQQQLFNRTQRIVNAAQENDKQDLLRQVDLLGSFIGEESQEEN